MTTHKDFRGILIPHITPFKRDGSIDTEALEILVDYWLRSGVHGLVPCASNGEGPYLTREERASITRRVLELAGSRVLVIGAVAAPGTHEAVAQARLLADMGVDAILVTPPFYYTPSKRELLAHYQYFLDHVDVPVLLYNVPKFVGYSIDISVLETLIEEYSQIVGIKESSGVAWIVTEITRRFGDKVSVFAGTGDTLLYTLMMGGAGGIIAVAIIAPRICVELYKSFTSKDYEKAAELQKTLTKLNTIITRRFNQISATKEALRLLGLPGGYPRLPLLPLEPGEVRELQGYLKDLGLLRHV